MTPIKRAARKAHASAPWVALVTSLAVPFLSFVESRDTARAARTQAALAEKMASKTTTEVDSVDMQTEAAFKLVVFELQRLAKDVDSCHARYSELEDKINELSSHHRSRRALRLQPDVERPPPQAVLPENYRNVLPESPSQ